MKNVLNLYAGIGGNRKLWANVNVTAVEIDPKIAEIYQDFFPNDKVIIADAHQYLLDHFKEFDFIWSSPPCPSHSRARFWAWSKKRPVFPDFTLYEEIVFLQYHAKCKWCVENVISYYKQQCNPISIGRHLFWSNFNITFIKHTSSDIRKLSGTSKKDKLKRNAVDAKLGKHILDCAYNKQTQQRLF